MSIINKILKLFSSKDSENYSDFQIHKLLQNAVKPTVKQYKNGHKLQFLKDENVERLIILRCFAFELWDLIIHGELHNKIYGRRINVIETALLRCEIASDENITLFANGYGLSAMSNLRLMLESLALSKYLWEKGEEEAKRFQDYMEFQKSDFEGTPLKMEDEHDEAFFKIYGWISDKEFNSFSKLVRKMGNADYDELLKISNNYIHATPYSLEKVWEMNHKQKGYFPIDLPNMIRLNERILVDFLLFTLDCFIDSEEKEIYKLFIKIIVDWM